MTLLAFGAKCGWPSAGTMSPCVGGEAVAVEHGAEREAGEAQADIGEERPAVHGCLRSVGDSFRESRRSRSVTYYRTVTKSVWLNSARTRFSRARRAGRLTARRRLLPSAFSLLASLRTTASVESGTSATRPVPVRAAAGRAPARTPPERTPRSPCSPARKLPGQHAAEPQAQFAVGQREGLLRQHGGRSTVGVARVGRVEDFEELHSRSRRGGRNRDCAGARSALILRNLRAAGRGIEFTRDGEQAVADHLRFEPVRSGTARGRCCPGRSCDSANRPPCDDMR